MKTNSYKHFRLLALVLLLAPSLAFHFCHAAKEELKYNTPAALVKDFLDLKKCPNGSCTDFFKAFEKIPNPKYRSGNYNSFFKELQNKLRTKNATIIALFLYQKRELFPEIKSLLEGRSKEELISIIDQRLKK